MTTRYSYERDGAAIYARSFGTIRAEADLSGLSPEEARIAVRVIHACGMIEITRDLRFGRGFAQAARSALLAGKPILCDAQMVAHGITRSRLPAGNDVVCTLGEPDVPAMAAHLGTTRSAAALDLWGDRLAGALVAIGNAPTALFRLLELLDAGAPLARGDHRHAGRICRRRRGQRSVGGRWAGAIPDRARPQGGQRHGGGGGQRAGERGGVMPGTLFIVGLGPGDPELMTLKAARIIAAAPVIAFFAKRGRAGHARGIAEGRIDKAAEQLRFEYPFTTEIAVDDPHYAVATGSFYEDCAESLASRLDAGLDVALLCEGDPFLYGSSMYLLDRLGDAYRSEVVPGVSGMSGCWTAARTPIVHGDDVLDGAARHAGRGSAGRAPATAAMRR